MKETDLFYYFLKVFASNFRVSAPFDISLLLNYFDVLLPNSLAFAIVLEVLPFECLTGFCKSISLKICRTFLR